MLVTCNGPMLPNRDLLPRPQRHMVHGIYGHGAIGVEPAKLDQFSLLLFVRHGVELLQIRGDAGRKVLLAEAHGIGGAFCFHGGKVREDGQTSKVLRLEVADDGSRVPDGDLDVGFQLEACAFEDGFAFLKHASDGVELTA